MMQKQCHSSGGIWRDENKSTPFDRNVQVNCLENLACMSAWLASGAALMISGLDSHVLQNVL